jgi:hypothetical protein
MALEATHIRFALDLIEDYKIQNIEQFLLGAIYPDSRYITNIDRNLTHNDEVLSCEFARDDFRKGWQVHQICDIVQNEIRKELFPESLYVYGVGYSEWVTSSAIKIIQDISDLKFFDIHKYLKYFESANNPNGENIDDIKKYNKTIIDLYSKKEISVNGYYDMWLSWGIGEVDGGKIKLKTEEFLNNLELVKKIQSIYGEMIKSYKEEPERF